MVNSALELTYGKRTGIHEHAKEQMAARNCDAATVEQIIANPVRGTYAPVKRDRTEHFGNHADGRAINVVTNKAVTVVITVVEQ